MDPLLHSGENMRTFSLLISNAPEIPQAESVVRDIVSGCAKVCPMGVLVKLAQVIVESRQQEIRDELMSR